MWDSACQKRLHETGSVPSMCQTCRWRHASKHKNNKIKNWTHALKMMLYSPHILWLFFGMHSPTKSITHQITWNGNANHISPCSPLRAPKMFPYAWHPWYQADDAATAALSWSLLFEGVCLTHVILTPGACGREGPSCSCCHHFGWHRWLSWCRDEFQKVSFCWTLHHFWHIDLQHVWQ